MAFSKRQRFEAFKRDAFTCQYCGRNPPTVILHADHVIPVAEGGLDDVNNLITSCADCNLGKSDVSLGSIPPQVAELAETTRERHEQLKAYNDMLMEVRREQEIQIEEIGRHWFNLIEKEKDVYIFGSNRSRNIKTFLKQLTQSEILDAIDIAAGKFHASPRSDFTRWKYFCGVCWGMIRRKKEQR